MNIWEWDAADVIRDAAFGVVVFLSEPDPEFIQMSHVI